MATRIEFEAVVLAKGFEAGLKEIERAAAATNARMNSIYEARRVYATERGLSTTQPFTREEERAWLRGKAEWNAIQASQTAIMLENFEKQRIAAAVLRDNLLADATAVARNGGIVGAALGGGHGIGGGVSFGGAIRETFVLLREGLRGNYSRMAGSLTLLASYTGTLGKLFKSSAQEAIFFAQAQDKLAYETAVAARASELKYRTALQEAEATLGSTAAAEAATQVQKQEATALLEAAAAQKVKAEAAAEAAEVEAAGAKFSVTALGWLTAAVIVLGIAAYELYKHFVLLEKQQKKWQESVDATRVTASQERQALEDNLRNKEELNKWLEKEISNRRDLMDITNQRIEALREEADAQAELMRLRGVSAVEVNKAEGQQLQAEEKILKATQDKAKATLAADKAKLQQLENEQSGFNSNGLNIGGQNYTLASAQRALAQATADLDEVNQMNLTHYNLTGKFVAGPEGIPIQQLSGPIAGPAPGQQIELSGKRTSTLEQIKSTIQTLTPIVNELSKKGMDLGDSISDTKDDLSAMSEAVRQSTNDLAKNQEQQKVNAIKAQIAALEDANKKPRIGSGTEGSLITTGNFLGRTQSSINNIETQKLALMRASNQHLKEIAQNTRHFTMNALNGQTWSY